METEFFAGPEEKVQCAPVQCVYKTVINTWFYFIFFFLKKILDLFTNAVLEK